MVEASPHRMPWNRGREDHTFPHAGEVCVMDECGRERCVCVPTGNIDGEAMCLLVVDGGTARDSRGPVCRRSAPPEWRRRRNEEGYWNARTHGYDVNTPDHPGAVHHSWWWRAPLVKLDGPQPDDEFSSCVGHLLQGNERMVSYGKLPSNLA